MQDKRYPKNHFMAVGMAVGIPLGIPMGLLLDMIVIGPLIGVALGAGIGVYLEKKYNPNPLQISVEDDRQRKKVILALAAFFLLGLLGLIALLMMI